MATILIVEDNDFQRNAIGALLQHFGYDYVLAQSGEKVIELLRGGQQCAAILMDVYMPEMNGITCTETIRQMHEYKELPIIGVTACSEPAEREACLAAGMSDYVTKPFTPEQLQKTLVRWAYDETANLNSLPGEAGR